MHILPSSWSQHWGSLDLQVLESHGPPHRDNSYCDWSWAFVPWHFSAEQHPLLGQPLGQTLRRTRAGFLKWMACMWRVARPHHFPPPALHAVFYCWASGNPKSCDPMATQHPLFSAPEPPASPSVVLQSVWVGSKHPRAPQTLSCPTAAADGAGPHHCSHHCRPQAREAHAVGGARGRAPAHVPQGGRDLCPLCAVLGSSQNSRQALSTSHVSVKGVLTCMWDPVK